MTNNRIQRGFVGTLVPRRFRWSSTLFEEQRRITFCLYFHCFLLVSVLCNSMRLVLSLQLAAACVMDASVADVVCAGVVSSERLCPSGR